MTTVEPDPANPSVWWVMLLKGVVGLQCGDTTAAKAYLDFVIKHRGEQAAASCRANLRRYARSEKFADAQAMLEQAEKK